MSKTDSAAIGQEKDAMDLPATNRPQEARETIKKRGKEGSCLGTIIS